MSSYRTQKVAEEIKHKLNMAMSKDLSELNLGLVTISKVIISPDLRIAKVYISILGNKEPAEKCLEKLNLRKKHIRFLLGKNLKLRHIPELNFFYDDTMEYAEHINKLLNKLKSENNQGNQP